MLTRICTNLLLFTFVFVSTGYSARLFPGYYIDNNGDSVLCRIDYNDRDRNPTTITVEVNNVRKALGVADIRGFGITGIADYQTATVSYHPGAISGSNLPEKFPEETVTNSVFLQVLVSGPYSLYSLTLPDRTYYFLKAANAPIQELVYRVKQAEMEIVTDEQYKSQLSICLEQEHLLDNDPYIISSLTYSRQKLVNLADKLNEARTGVKSSPHLFAKSKRHPLEFDLFVAGMMNSFPETFPTNFSTTKFPATFGGAGGLGVRITIPGHFETFSVGLNIGYTAFKSSTSFGGTSKVGVLSNSWYTQVAYNENVSVSNSLITTNLDLIYQLPDESRVRPYLKAGFNFDIILKSSGNVYSNWNGDFVGYHSTNPPEDYGSRGGSFEAVEFAQKVVCATFAVGIRMDRHRVELAYNTPMELSASGQSSFKLTQYGLYYYFAILK